MVIDELMKEFSKLVQMVPLKYVSEFKMVVVDPSKEMKKKNNRHHLGLNQLCPSILLSKDQAEMTTKMLE